MNAGDLSAGLVFVVAAPQMIRPADTTAYASGDLVANNTTAGSVTPLKFRVGRDLKRGLTIIKARLRKSGTGTSGASFRLHLYRRQPTVTNGDNGAYVSNEADDYLGYCQFDGMMTNGAGSNLFSDGAAGNGVPGVGSTIECVPVSGTDPSIWGLLEARGAYTPGNAETFDISLEGYAD